MDFPDIHEDMTDFDLFRRDSIPGYTILSEIGKGATGAVFAARNNESGKLVAVKILFPHYSKNREYVKRVSREAELSQRIRHPNVVSGYEFGRAGELFFMVMEYVAGKTLAQILKERTKIPEKEAAEIILQVARALDEAHKFKVIHRDIKPANICLTSDNVAKLMDFGLAKEELDTSITVHGTILGTPCYISPEQARGEISIDVRSDIYSLGITLYHMIIGEPPFCEFNTTLMLTKKTTDPIPSPKIKDTTLSDEICYICEKMTERDVAQRYQNPTHLINDIQAYLSGKLQAKCSRRSETISITISPKEKEKRQQIVKRLADKIDDPAIRDLLQNEKTPGEPVIISPGCVLFYEGEQSRETYLLLKGDLEVLKAGRKVATIKDSGSFVGEMATLLNSQRTATVRALTDSVLLKITEDDFQNFLSCAPELAYRLAKHLAKHLYLTTVKLKEFQSRIGAIRNYFQLMSDELSE